MRRPSAGCCRRRRCLAPAAQRARARDPGALGGGQLGAASSSGLAGESGSLLGAVLLHPGLVARQPAEPADLDEVAIAPLRCATPWDGFLLAQPVESSLVGERVWLQSDLKAAGEERVEEVLQNLPTHLAPRERVRMETFGGVSIGIAAAVVAILERESDRTAPSVERRHQGDIERSRLARVLAVALAGRRGVGHLRSCAALAAICVRRFSVNDMRFQSRVCATAAGSILRTPSLLKYAMSASVISVARGCRASSAGAGVTRRSRPPAARHARRD